MARIVDLRAGENPAEGEKWVLVHREEAVRASGVNVTQHDDGATFSVSPDEADLSSAISQASAWADARGISTVYVRR